VDIELPACFYLGREYDLARRQPLDQPVMYDARDLTTHGVVVGMTGSGKTGLGITLLEEAAIDGIPSIIIDPKGDLTNLLLQFPNLDPVLFRRWLNADDARQKGISAEQLAAELAARWRQGLVDSLQTPDRIIRLQAAAEWRIYTPGSEAGLPLSLLGTFVAPPAGLPREALNQKIDATAMALLGLSGIAGDAVQSREHILIAQLLLHSWSAGRSLDLPQLIQQIQNPPVRTVGTYNVDAFFPARERHKFASALNNVLAAPGFSTWITGEPLDLGRMLYAAGKPRQLIFYVAHLDDRQRMFFTTLLLEEVLSWTRKQTGTNNLRALVYFDEVAGYLPPHPRNPPSKAPLMTLMKQARAFGVGVLLATQNPVDLDYKALSNAGTWFVGKLQTERDKQRLLEGLESVAAEQGTLTDRAYLETVISSLGNRLFLMHSVHRPRPLLFQSRWALTFLRGPMTREQVQELMDPVKRQLQATAPMAIPLCTWCHAELGTGAPDVCPQCGKMPWARAHLRVQDKQFKQGLQRGEVPLATTAAPTSTPSVDRMAPVLPPEVTQFYLPVRRAAASGARLEYRARVLGFAEVVFVTDKRKGKEHRQTHHLLAAAPAAGHPVDWAAAETIGETLAQPESGARWASAPETLDTGRKLRSLEKAFAEFLVSTLKLSLLQNRVLELVSEPGEGRAAFQTRCRAAAGQAAEGALAVEKAKFGPKFEALNAQLPEDQPPAHGTGQATSWLDRFNPFKTAASALPSKPRSKAEERQQERLRKLTADWQAKKAELAEKWKRIGEEMAEIQVKPRKADVRVTHFGLAWVPFWVAGTTSGVGTDMAAYR
jgi:hypothetical protein